MYDGDFSCTASSRLTTLVMGASTLRECSLAPDCRRLERWWLWWLREELPPADWSGNGMDQLHGNIQVSTVSVPRQVWTLVLKLFTVTSNGRNIVDRFSRTSWEEVSFNFQHESTPLARYHKPLKSDKVFILLEKEWVSLSKATIKLNLNILSRWTIVAEWKLMILQWITWAIFSFWE